MKGVRSLFTLIEMMATVALIAISFIPVMELFATGLQLFREARYHRTAVELALEGLVRLKLTGDSAEELALQSVTRPPVVDEVDGVRWETQVKVEPLRVPPLVRIVVFRGGEAEKPAFELVTFWHDDL